MNSNSSPEKNGYLVKVLEEHLTTLCTSKGVLDGDLYIVEELEDVWTKCAPEYMVDAVPEIAKYPTVAIAWAAYFGLGIASLWDANWDTHKESENLYKFIRDKRGFDCMDEYVTEELVATDAKDGKLLADLIGDCSTLALTLIRKENIEAQSVEAFYLFADFTKVFFKLGVSLELYRLGYKYQKMIFN